MLNPAFNVIFSIMAATCYASGLAASSTIAHLLHTGERMICIDDVYGGTGRLFRRLGKATGFIVDFVDFVDPEHLRDALTPNTKVGL